MKLWFLRVWTNHCRALMCRTAVLSQCSLPAWKTLKHPLPSLRQLLPMCWALQWWRLQGTAWLSEPCERGKPSFASIPASQFQTGPEPAWFPFSCPILTRSCFLRHVMRCSGVWDVPFPPPKLFESLFRGAGRDATPQGPAAGGEAGVPPSLPPGAQPLGLFCWWIKALCLSPGRIRHWARSACPVTRGDAGADGAGSPPAPGCLPPALPLSKAPFPSLPPVRCGAVRWVRPGWRRAACPPPSIFALVPGGTVLKLRLTQGAPASHLPSRGWCATVPLMPVAGAEHEGPAGGAAAASRGRGQPAWGCSVLWQPRIRWGRRQPR